MTAIVRRFLVSRRLLLQGLPGGVVGIAAGGLSAEPAGAEIVAAVRALYPHRESAARVGAAYLAERPTERDRDRLIRQLSQDLDVERWRRHGRWPAMMRARVRRQIRADARRGRVVRLHDDVLSVTEARLCALAFLTS